MKSALRVDQQAAEWVVRRDRGLTAEEQDRYLQWLQDSPMHAAAVGSHEAALRRLLQLQGLAGEPARDDSHGSPSAFAPARLLVRFGTFSAAAAALALLVWRVAPVRPTAAQGGAVEEFLQINARQTLADGSVVELKKGSEIDVHFSAGERRVVLRRGEANFTVTHNARRPFVVEAGSAQVTDVGTVFDVRRDPTSVQVLVTAGSVSVNRPGTAEVRAGQRALIDLADRRPALVAPLAAPMLDEALAWQKPRFEFTSTPLAVAVAAFNRRSSGAAGPRLVIGDSALAAVRIGGTLHADDAEDFVRLLAYTEGIRAERRGGGEIVLRAGR